MGKFIDLTGRKFGRLTVIEFNKIHEKHGYGEWKCLCSCGNEKIISRGSLISGSTNSCGCLQKEKVTTHGLFYRPEYKVWQTMLTRCYNKSAENYPSYGGRGIIVSDEWKVSFETFFRDLGERPQGKTLDRIDNNGNYCKENCRWATTEEQSSNRRDNKFITFNGKTQTISEWAREYNINSGTLNARIFRYKWDIFRALTSPIQILKRKLT